VPRLFSAALASLTIVVACLLPTRSHAADKDKHVIVVCIDGLAAYLLDDPKAPIPMVRELAKSGSFAEGGMRVSNPSVTWPNHTSIITGVRPEKHGVLANGVLVRGAPGSPVTIDGKRDQHELVRVPTILDIAHAAGLRTAEINWPCMRGSKSLDDSFADVPDQVTHMTPRLRSELVAKGILQDETQKSFMASSPPQRDHVWTEAACHVIRNRKPNLMFIHLLNVDSTHHAEGAQTPAGYTANAYADACLRRIVEAVDDAGIRDQTTVLVVSDHGFITTPKAIKPNVVLRDEGLLKVTAGKIGDARVHVISEGGIGLVYCTEPGEAVADAQRVKQLFVGKEGVEEVLLPEDFAKLGMPHPREYSQAPDAIIVAKEGYAVSNSAEGDDFVAPNTEAKTSLGSHGFVSTQKKMNAMCVLSGSGIRQGEKLQEVENIDLAPTIAAILELKGLPADGKPLKVVLTE